MPAEYPPEIRAQAELELRRRRLLREDPQAAYRERVRQGQEGFLAWALQYLPDHFYSEPGDFHHEIAALAEEHPRLALAAPRGFAKTTVLALAYPLYRLAVKREPYIFLVSDTATQAEQRTSDIYKELLENERLLSDYPHMRLPDPEAYRKKFTKRTTVDFIVEGGMRVAGAGAGESLRGRKSGHERPSLIIVDDLENDESVMTAYQRQKLHSWFTKALLNLPGPKGAQVIVIGTILHFDSLLSWLLKPEQGRVWKQRLFRAIKDDGEPLWPQVWPLERLEEKRIEVGEYAFASEFMNQPVPPGQRLFKTPFRYTTLPDLPYLSDVGFDAAYTARAHADYSVALKGELRGDVLYLTGMERHQMEAGAFLDLLVAQGVTHVTWFRSGAEKSMEQFMVAKGISVNAIPATTDKHTRATPVADAWNRQKVAVPDKNSPYYGQWVEDLLEEVLYFTGVGDAHDDIVDALSALHYSLWQARELPPPIGWVS